MEIAAHRAHHWPRRPSGGCLLILLLLRPVLLIVVLLLLGGIDATALPARGEYGGKGTALGPSSSTCCCRG